jgi:L-ascorbate metabolism protein UlaG (beta-lactamase superfamily)
MRSTTFYFTVLFAVTIMVGNTLADPDSAPTSSAVQRRERMKRSPNFESGHFVNEVPTSTVNFGELWGPLSDQLVPTKRSRPTEPLPSIAVNIATFDTASGLKAVWLGHSTLLVRIDSVTLLFDPVFEEYTKHAMGSSLRFQPSPLSRNSLPQIDAVVISHDHFDHLEQKTVEYLALKGVAFFVPLGVGSLLEEWLVPDSQIVELDWWETARIKSVELNCTPARHYSGRTFSSVNKTLWSSWVIVGPKHRLFFGGDTGYFDRFKEIGKHYGPFDLTLIPIGAYDDAWPDIHLSPEEAVIVHIALNGKLLLPIHWGTFDLAAHSWSEPIKRLVKAAGDEDIDLVVPRLGEIVDPHQQTPSEYWWQDID